MPRPTEPPYNGHMTSTASMTGTGSTSGAGSTTGTSMTSTETDVSPSGDVSVLPSAAPSRLSRLTAPGVFLQHLSTGDFARLSEAFEPDVRMQALLPRGLDGWEGSDAVCGAFERFFGAMDEYDLVGATTGQVGERIEMSWRLHLGGARLGPGRFVVEQRCYADAGPTGRLGSIALVCSGYCMRSPT